MTKKYKILLSVLIAKNYQVEVGAENEKEAIKAAIEDYRMVGSGSFEDSIDGECQENFCENSKRGIAIEQLEDSTKDDQQKIQDLHNSQGKFGTIAINEEDEDFEIIDLDVDSVINQAISQLTAEEIDQQIKRGEEPDVILAGQKIYQQASALEESGKAWFKLNK